MLKQNTLSNVELSKTCEWCTVYSFEINSEPTRLVWRCELRRSDNTVRGRRLK